MRKKFIVVFFPFALSDIEGEREVWAKDEDEAAKYFANNFPLWRVKEVRAA